jgi:hypothetical protein
MSIGRAFAASPSPPDTASTKQQPSVPQHIDLAALHEEAKALITKCKAMSLTDETMISKVG